MTNKERAREIVDYFLSARAIKSDHGVEHSFKELNISIEAALDEAERRGKVFGNRIGLHGYVAGSFNSIRVPDYGLLNIPRDEIEKCVQQIRNGEAENAASYLESLYAK